MLFKKEGLVYWNSRRLIRVCGCCGAAQNHYSLGVLAGYDQRVLLGGAADHFVAGFQGHPRPGLWRARLASFGDPNALEDDEDASAVRLDGAFRLLLLGHGQPSHFGGTLRQRCCETSDPVRLTTHQGLAHKAY